MTLQEMSCINAKQLIKTPGLIILVTVLLLSPCYADEIIFKDKKDVKIGTVIRIDENTVTIRFSREAIQSIVMGQERDSSGGKTGYLKSIPLTDNELQEKVKRVQERIERLERKEEDKRSAVSPTPGPSQKLATHEKLLQEEMGSVQGIILYKGKPLNNGKVKIVLEQYTGFSMASLKRMFKAGEDESSKEEIILVGQADSQGRYSFPKAPPGFYRIYWLPRNQTGWFHRFRDRPDFKVISGNLTIQNIPEKKR